jgi:hypothetical protein
MGRSIACYRHGCDHHGTPWKYELPALHQLGKVNTRLVKNEIIGNRGREVVGVRSIFRFLCQ